MTEIRVLLETQEHAAATYPKVGTTAPNPAVMPVWVDTTTLPPVLKGWDGTAWVPLGGAASASVTGLDNGNGLVALSGGGVTDNGDGLLILTGTGFTDNGDGILTIAA